MLGKHSRGISSIDQYLPLVIYTVTYMKRNFYSHLNVRPWQIYRTGGKASSERLRYALSRAISRISFDELLLKAVVVSAVVILSIIIGYNVFSYENHWT